MNKMFCFQCEQTARGTGCDGRAGVCGKQEDTANLQDGLIGALIGLARATNGEGSNAGADGETDLVMIESMFMTITNANFDNESINSAIKRINAQKNKLSPNCGGCPSMCGKNDDYNMRELWNDANPDIRSLKSLVLFGLKGIAAYAYHAEHFGYRDREITDFFYKALNMLGDKLELNQYLDLVLETGKINLKCMEILDKANTESLGTPTPCKVPLKIEKGPFIVVSGHDLCDLLEILKQTEGKGINIYTHSEMLPAHGYPKLKAYPHLKGNFGTAWQNQQKEFDNIPGAILFTTNCLMPVRESYKDRVFTTAAVGYPELKHIGKNKDFTPVINKALEFGGYKEDKEMFGINGGAFNTTGFGHGTVLSIADKVIDAVKSGAIKRFFLVGGCDGAKPGRNYYTDFVKNAPADTVILTLACGKYRFNDLDIGSISGIPRILDVGQCNDAYGAVKIALTLADAFKCGVNDLPLSYILSWFEQKAVAVLLTLLYLGVKNIHIGPSLPAFISPNVLEILVKNYGITPISNPEADLKKILG